MRRREFLKASAGVFAVASASRVLGAGAPSNRVRLALAGCHRRGRGAAILSSILRVPGSEVAYVCDVDSRAMDFAAAAIKKATGKAPKKEGDIRKVVADPELDGIISETPDHWHAYSAWLAMKNGKNVYVEKPCLFCPGEGEILIKAQKESGKVFQMGSQRRSSRSYRQAFAYLDSAKPIGELKFAKSWYAANRGSIGKGRVMAPPGWLNWDLWQGPAPHTDFRGNVVHYNWHWFKRWGTAESGNNAPHFLDIGRWALGGDYPAETQCTGGRFFDLGDDYEWPDTFNMAFTFGNGKYLTWEGTSHNNQLKIQNMQTAVVVYGEGGSILFGPADTVELFDANGKSMRKWKAGGDTDAGSLTNPTRGLDCDHLTNYVEAIRANDPSKAVVPVDVAVKTSIMPLVGNIALELNKPIKLDPKTGKLQTSVPAKLWSREYEKGWEMA